MSVFAEKKINWFSAAGFCTGLVITLCLLAACSSAPVEQAGKPASAPVQAVQEPLCVHQYSQADLDRELSLLKLPENRRDYASDAAYANFREIKTTGIRPGQWFRSSHPAMPGTRPPFAARLAEQAKVFTVLNLSDSKDQMVQYASRIPWYQSFLNRDSITALETGTNYFDSDFAQKLNAGIQYMLLRRGPYLIHCEDGKDRTGFVVVLFAALMGASQEEIIEDYMQSYVNYYGFTKDEERYKIISQVAHTYLCTMNGGHVVNDANISTIAEKFLLEKVKLSQENMADLKQRLGN